MPKACWQIKDEEDMYTVHRASLGDIITIEGKLYKVNKKTKTACSVTRYYWFNRMIDKWFKEKNVR